MSDIDFRLVNLNLLPALDALLRDRSVTAAARRMGVTQSAMSHSLARLRELLDDPLLVQEGRTMALTPRAQELAAGLRGALQTLAGVLSPESPFDPQTSDREFVIASYDYFEMIAVPELLSYFESEAPSIRLRIQRLSPTAVEAAMQGEIDFLIASPETRLRTRGLRSSDLFQDEFAVIAAREHPGIGQRLTLRRYVELPHVVVSLGGPGSEGVVDIALRRKGESRRVALRLTNFLSAPVVIARSEAICTLPATIAERAAQMVPLRIMRPPLPLPRPTVSLYWPRSRQADDGHRWLRDCLQSGVALSEEMRQRLF